MLVKRSHAVVLVQKIVLHCTQFFTIFGIEIIVKLYGYILEPIRSVALYRFYPPSSNARVNPGLVDVDQ